jgi:hypothetical protein
VVAVVVAVAVDCLGVGELWSDVVRVLCDMSGTPFLPGARDWSPGPSQPGCSPVSMSGSQGVSMCRSR